MDFTNEEKRDMIKIYYKYDRNSVRTSEEYLLLYPERRQPNRTMFKFLDENLAEFGSFKKPRKKYGERMDEETKENVINEVQKLYFLVNHDHSAHKYFSHRKF